MHNFELSDMPGPTVEAQQLQLEQYAAGVAHYDLINAECKVHPQLSLKEVRQLPSVVAANQVYEDFVTKLEEMLGKDAHCRQIDGDLWESFADCYKEDVGIRPRFHQTRAEVLQYFDRRKEAVPVE